MKNVLWLSTDRIIKICGNFLIFILLAKQFNLSDFGRLTLFLAVVATVGTITSFGQYQALVKLLKDNTGETEKYIVTSTVFLSASLAISSLLYLIIFRYIEHDYILFSTLAVIFTTNIYMQIVRAWSDADQDSRRYLKIELAAFLFFFVIKLAMIQIETSVTQILMIIALEQFALSLWCFLKYVPLPRKNSLPDYSIFINLAKHSFPLMLTALTVSLYMRIDQFMLLHLINVESVAIYSFYIRFVEAGYIPLTILGTHYAPTINEYFRRIPSKIGLIKFFNHFLLMGLLIATLGIVIFNVAQSLIIPNAYRGYESLFYYGVVLIPCIAVGIVSNQILVATDCTRSLVKRSLIAIALNITLNFILIPFYGISGALYASIATQVSVTFLATLLHQPTMSLLVPKK